MQRRAFLITGLTAGLVSAAGAAEAVTEGFTGFSASGTTSLERQTAVMKSKTRDPIGAVQVIFYQLWGARSRVRFTSSSLPSFVVNGPPEADPQTRYALFRLAVAKGARHLETGRDIPSGSTNLNIQARSKVAFTAARYGADFFKLDVAEPLTPGEYAWVSLETLGTKFYGFGGKAGEREVAVYAFGVD